MLKHDCFVQKDKLYLEKLHYIVKGYVEEALLIINIMNELVL